MCDSKDCGHNKTKCRCQIRGFLRAALLLILSNGERYGYTLQQEIIDKGLREKVDIGSIYRNLRNLEKAGYVSSKWRESSNGPEQRVYIITKSGKEHLQSLKTALQNERRKIDTFLEMVKNS